MLSVVRTDPEQALCSALRRCETRRRIAVQRTLNPSCLPVRCTTNILTRPRQPRSREQRLNKVCVAYRRHPQRNQRRQRTHEKQNPLRRHFVVGAVIAPRPKHQRPAHLQRDLITPGGGPRAADGRLGSFDAPRMCAFFRMDISIFSETAPAAPPAGQTTPSRHPDPLAARKWPRATPAS